MKMNEIAAIGQKVDIYEGVGLGTMFCPRCAEYVEFDPRDFYDWQHGRRWHEAEMMPVGDFLCRKCRDECWILWEGKHENEFDGKIDPMPEPAPTPPDVKRECATCEGVFDVPIDTPCATCYGHTNWRPGAKK